MDKLGLEYVAQRQQIGVVSRLSRPISRLPTNIYPYQPPLTRFLVMHGGDHRQYRRFLSENGIATISDLLPGQRVKVPQAENFSRHPEY